MVRGLPKAIRRSVSRNRRQHQRELRRLVGAPWDSPEAMDLLRNQRVSSAVLSAVEHSPFYRELLGSNCEIPSLVEDLGSLPVTSKADLLQSEFDRARPARRFDRRATWGTSGSSGEPYTFQIDHGYPARHAAQRAFVYLRAGLAPGSRLVEVLPGLRGGPDDAYPTFERIRIGYAIDGLPDAVAAAAPDLLFGNRSHLLQIADWAEADERHSLRPRLVCSSSEMLHAEDEGRLARVFHARVLEIYGSAEASNIAFRLPSESTWRILEPRIVVEVLDEARVPVAPGEIGEIVVTTLTEPTSPLIRYATGDLARVHSGHADGTSGLTLEALEGRSADALVDANGRHVPFWSIASSLFWASQDVARHVKRWQVHQRADRSLIVSLEMKSEGQVAEVSGEIQRHLSRVLGDLPVDVVAKDRVHGVGTGKFRAVTSDASVGAAAPSPDRATRAVVSPPLG